MKTPLTVLLLAALVSPVCAQDQKKIFGEKIGSSEKIVKGAPFSAEAVSESIQVFADGNRIVRRSVSRVYRDSEGRYRREDMPRQLGIPGAVVEMPESVLILDPVAGYRYQLNPNKSTGNRTVLKNTLVNKLNRDSKFTLDTEKRNERLAKQAEERVKQNEERVKQIEERVKQNEERQKRKEERVKQNEERVKQTQLSAKNATDVAGETTPPKKEIPPLSSQLKELTQEVQEASKSVELWKQEQLEKRAVSDEKTESLGIREIEGVQAEGTRITTTIPAGAIGNEREIVVINERWYSNDLQMIVLSKRNDPGFGEQTYRLTNINRTEPAMSLFAPPDGYQIADGKPPMKLVRPVVGVPALPGKPALPAKPIGPVKAKP